MHHHSKFQLLILHYLMPHYLILHYLMLNYFKIVLFKYVSLIISYQLYFFRISKVWNMLHHGSVDEFRVKNASLCLHTLLTFFIAIHQKICVFIIFISFFDEVSTEFPQQNINQSEIGIGENKLLVKLYDLMLHYFSIVLQHGTI